MKSEAVSPRTCVTDERNDAHKQVEIERTGRSQLLRTPFFSHQHLEAAMITGLRTVCILLLLGTMCLRAQNTQPDSRTAIPAQKEGTVYLVNDSDHEIQFSLSYTARNWSDYELDAQHACVIPVRDFGYEEVVIRYVEKIGIEQTFKLEANERYRFIYKEALKEWKLERLR